MTFLGGRLQEVLLYFYHVSPAIGSIIIAVVLSCVVVAVWKMCVRLPFLFLQVEIFADTVAGQVSIVTSGGNGKRGQDGSEGRKGADSSAKV